MKKSAFLQGTMIATISVIVTKILGIIYVIPFYAIIGEKGGALYGYAYSIYSIFLSISSVGIPLAMSKIVSEYNALGYYDVKERAFKIGKNVILMLSVISFIILFVFAPFIAHIFIGDITGGNTIEEVTFVIRLISTAILIVPLLSVTRGYLQGHRYITPPSISQIIEQVARVIVIVCGSYLCLRIFNFPLKVAVGVSVFAATIGALFSYGYLVFKINKNKQQLNVNNDQTTKTINITKKDLVLKILTYSIPFVFSSLIVAFYQFIDLSTIVKTMVNRLNYLVFDAETTISILSTWGMKLNMIVMAISTGMTASLIPNITGSYIKKDMDGVRSKITRSIELLLFLTLPMTVGLSLLAKPVWTVFYGYSDLGSMVFSYSIFITIFTSMCMVLNVIIQSLSEYKKMFIFILVGFIIKLVFNIPLMYSFDYFGFHASYGAITATIFGQLVSIMLILNFLSKKFNINYEKTLKNVITIIMTTVIMALIIFVCQFIIPIDMENRLLALLSIIFYSLFGAYIYIFIMAKNKLLYEVFGKSFVEKILSKLKKYSGLIIIKK